MQFTCPGTETHSLFKRLQLLNAGVMCSVYGPHLPYCSRWRFFNKRSGLRSFKFNFLENAAALFVKHTMASVRARLREDGSRLYVWSMWPESAHSVSLGSLEIFFSCKQNGFRLHFSSFEHKRCAGFAWNLFSSNRNGFHWEIRSHFPRFERIGTTPPSHPQASVPALLGGGGGGSHSQFRRGDRHCGLEL